MAPVLVFDIETIPDTEIAGKRLYDMEGLPMKEAAELMLAAHRRESRRQGDFLNHCLHRIVAISVVLADPRKTVKVLSLGTPEDGEKTLIRDFFKGVEAYTPTLVSWNGSGFDLPVLHYRALLHGVVCARYWDNGSEGFRWNNYTSRYHSRHTDLMDVLSAYTMGARTSLDKIAQILGFPGKMGLKGDQVWDLYQQGDIDAIRNYCETDVLNTYLVYLRYELIRGRLSSPDYTKTCDALADMLAQKEERHLQEFLRVWQQGQEG
ncbi:MAG: 3'-5' exonuclease [Candidatus Eutrophobiaceae bacterium]